MITVKRLDFTGTINAMLCCTARHALLSDGARQNALDDLTAALNNVAAIIVRNNLSRQLDGPIPPVPPRHQADDDEMDALDAEDDEDTDDSPVSQPTPPPAHSGPGAGLTISQSRVLSYISGHADCTMDEMCKALQMSNTSISTHVSAIRRAGIPIIAKGRPANYRLAKKED